MQQTEPTRRVNPYVESLRLDAVRIREMLAHTTSTYRKEALEKALNEVEGRLAGRKQAA